jgi:hypothetical protein
VFVTYLQPEKLGHCPAGSGREAYCLRRAIDPAIFSDCSPYDIYRRNGEEVIRIPFKTME